MTQAEKRYIFSCMLGQERSVELQSMAKNNGYDAELMAGGLLSISHQIEELHKKSGTDEDIFSFISNIKEHVLNNSELIDLIETNSSHAIYFRDLLTTVDLSEKKYVVTIDKYDRMTNDHRINLGLMLLSVFGEVHVVDLAPAMVAILSGNLDEFLANS